MSNVPNEVSSEASAAAAPPRAASPAPKEPEPKQAYADLDALKRLCARAAEPPAETLVERRREDGFVVFRADRARARLAAESAPGAPTFAGESADWARLLAWLVGSGFGRAAFVADPQGLLVALAGAVDAEVAGAMASRVAIAFEQAERLVEDRPSAASLTFDLGELHVLGLRQRLGGEAVVLGVVSDGPMADEKRLTVVATLATLARALG